MSPDSTGHDLHLEWRLTDHLAVSLHRYGTLGVDGHDAPGGQVLDVRLLAVPAPDDVPADAQVIEEGLGPKDADIDPAVVDPDIGPPLQPGCAQGAAVGQHRPGGDVAGCAGHPPRLRSDEAGTR